MPALFSQQKAAYDILETGYHVVLVECEDMPDYAYTIGLAFMHEHPEILISGLSLEQMYPILALAAERVMQGGEFKDCTLDTELLEGRACAFRHVARPQEDLECADMFYDGQPFGAVQIYWPDPEGHFPWEMQYDGRFRELQTDFQSA